MSTVQDVTDFIARVRADILKYQNPMETNSSMMPTLNREWEVIKAGLPVELRVEQEHRVRAYLTM